MEDVKFSYVKSLADAPFFAELSKLKLDHVKLDSREIELSATVSAPLSSNRSPTVRVSADSFNVSNPESSSRQFYIPGLIRNTNTIEEFRDLDKLQLQRELARRVGEDIRCGKTVGRPELLSQFYLLTFADLKKYKYYFWFMFPSLKWTSTITASERTTSSQLEEVMSKCTSLVCSLNETTPGNFLVGPLNASSNVLGVVDTGSVGDLLPWHLRNLAAQLSHQGIRTASIYIYRRSGGSRWIELDVGTLSAEDWEGAGAEGWERNAQNKLVPKFTDLSTLMNPLDLAKQATDLNLKLMKWRAAPEIDLEAIAANKCLLLGAGTLGSYIARGLLAWGVRHITFIDSGTVSYSNPVRQPLYTHEDCVAQAPKAETAAQALKRILPTVESKGYQIEIPMAGHPITNETRQKEEYELLVKQIENHDVVFLLMDSRESRWLPTVICRALKKTVIDVALGFDTYLVMRHGVNEELGCYFCNDVVAPSDSISRQTLDQMCTVTRPGGAMIASGYAVELFAQIAQHKDRAEASVDAETVLGPIPHQVRGFLKTHENVKIWGPAFAQCSACGPSIDLWQDQGWEFVKQALNDPNYVTESSGLGELQRQTEALEIDSDSEGELN